MARPLSGGGGAAQGPDFSILISTRDRAPRLGACLAALSALRGDHAREFLLIDNGSSDETAAVLERFRTAGPHSVTLLHEPRPGVAWGLNRAIERARGRILLFTDDDCYADPGLLDAYAALFVDPALGFAGGRVLRHDPAAAPVGIRDVAEAEPMPPRSFVVPGLIQGGNMALRRDALLEVGALDPNFGAGARFSGYDIDACARVCAAGWAGLYHPAPTVRHDHRRSDAASARQLRRYALGSGAYLAKRLITSPHRRRELSGMLGFSYRGLRVPWIVPARLLGFLQYPALRLAGRLHPVERADPPAPELLPAGAPA